MSHEQVFSFQPQPTPLSIWFHEADDDGIAQTTDKSEPYSPDWWQGRFLPEEILSMSEVGRQIFIHEVRPGHSTIQYRVT